MHSINKGNEFSSLSPTSLGGHGPAGSCPRDHTGGHSPAGIMRVGSQSAGSQESDHGPPGSGHGVTRVRPWATGSQSRGHEGWSHGPRGHGVGSRSTVTSQVTVTGSRGWVRGHGVTRVGPRARGHEVGSRSHGVTRSDATAVESACRLAYPVTGVPPKTQSQGGQRWRVGTRSLGWGGAGLRPARQEPAVWATPFPPDPRFP